MNQRHMFSVLAAALLVSAAWADTIYMVDGGKVEGRITINDGKAYIEMASGGGTVVIDELYVLRIEKKKTALDEFDEQLAALEKKEGVNAADYVKLGQWATGKGLTLPAKKAYSRAVELDPNNVEARKALGYQLHQGQWMTPDEIAVSQGLVKYKGVWLTRAQVGELLKLELQAEQEKQKALAERLEAQRQKAEADAERARAEAERQQRLTADYYDRLQSCGFGIYGGRCGNGYGYYGYNTQGWPYYSYPNYGVRVINPLYFGLSGHSYRGYRY